VVHEAAVPRVLPQARKWQRFFAGVYVTACRFGSYLAALRFMLGAELPVRKLARAQTKATEYTKSRREQSGEHRISNMVAADVLVKLELLPVTNYLPDVELIKKNEVRVFIAVGEWALERKTWYVQAAQILAEKLGCELVTFPGHHGSYMDMPEEWAATLRSVLHKAERNRGTDETPLLSWDGAPNC
jgi:hypothetical protein